MSTTPEKTVDNNGEQKPPEHYNDEPKTDKDRAIVGLVNYLAHSTTTLENLLAPRREDVIS